MLGVLCGTCCLTREGEVSLGLDAAFGPRFFLSGDWATDAGDAYIVFSSTTLASVEPAAAAVVDILVTAVGARGDKSLAARVFSAVFCRLL